MQKIFCLMGKSSTGKDSIFSILKNSNILKPIVSYTTRPMRDNEQDGREYNFINEKQLKKYEAENKIIEQRVYHTVNGPWYYATIDDEQFNVSDSYIMIVTLEAYASLVKYFGQDKVIPIYIEVEDGERLQRAIKREQQQSKPNYEEVCRRFLADNRDFSKHNLKCSNIQKKYINDNIDDCIQEIIRDINTALSSN